MINKIKLSILEKIKFLLCMVDDITIQFLFNLILIRFIWAKLSLGLVVEGFNKELEKNAKSRGIKFPAFLNGFYFIFLYPLNTFWLDSQQI